MNNLLLIMCLSAALMLSGCATKATEIQFVYKEKEVPVPCIAKMPKKPISDGSFEGDKQKMIYYRKCEDLLKQCIGKK